MRIIKLTVTLLSGILVFAACEFSRQKYQGGGGGTIPKDKSTVDFASLSSAVLEPRCVRCHNADVHKGGVDLSTYEAVMGENGLVAAGEPNNSTLYTIVADGEMPPKGGMSNDEIEYIFKWIELGANKNRVNIETTDANTEASVQNAEGTTESTEDAGGTGGSEGGE